MPLEIRELVIKINVQEQQQQQEITEEALKKLKDKIVNECLAKVIKKIEKSQDR